MAIKIQMPKLSDTMSEGRIIKWLKKEGEKVGPGDVIAEVETDKANMDMEAYDEGTLLKIVAKEGDRVPIGGLIAVLGEAGEDASAILNDAASTPKKDSTRETITEPVEARQSSVGNVYSAAAPTVPTPAPSQPAATKDNGRLKASPLAKRLAQERGIDIGEVKGSGTSGRIVRRDVEGFSPVVSSSAAKYTDVPLSMMREAIAKRLAQSNIEAPHFFLTAEVKMENAIAFRESLNQFDEKNKISYNDIIVKACAAALKEHPQVNATFLGDKIRMFSNVHIGIAVAIDDGLITPVLRDADKKGLRQISQEAKELAVQARDRKLKPEEYSGSTFTVSNLGMYDVDDFTAIINPPEAAILAVGSIVEKPVAENGELKIGKRMRITLSSDHRVIDGALAARFMQTLKKVLENPAALAL
ncbi:MAG: pyruvate dehydrogenase complex dihydrolipoamide acetyltransferase [Bacteroidetes bacterium]|nr:pyruvate dehydrogenase complex dihydrolipoamide acetyltransferase [Bacteroidota bacterium]MCL5737641.1 pyruvate dehydrogenase complex dihydrolipoamide acetyltransferase [Bacteroidota bacterium]